MTWINIIVLTQFVHFYLIFSMDNAAQTKNRSIAKAIAELCLAIDVICI
jgi:hypothetical protein